ncbi:MAG TPA: FtsX-like permease family protein, partial [Blastocatellia bacterium]
AGLLVRSFINLQEVKPGFNPQGVLTMQMSLPQSKYRERFQQAAFFDEAIKKISTLPGVEAAGVIDNVPMGGNNSQASFTIEGLQVAPGESSPHGDVHMASPDYFKAIGISLIRGRFFNEHDTMDSSPVVIVDETLAERYWPGEDAIGKRMGAFFDRANGQVRMREIVGVVSHVKQYGLDGKSRVQYYFPLSQRPQPAMFMVVRTTPEPSGMVASVRSAIQSVDRDQPVFRVRTMETIVSESMAQKRFATYLLGIFAAVAMLLAVIGIYGVMSYSVSQRTHEIGIRMALGADQGDVMRLVVGRGMFLAIIGVAVGLAGAFAATRLMESLLFGVTATDTITFVVIPFALAAVASVASYLPARRATRVDPMSALRCE